MRKLALLALAALPVVVAVPARANKELGKTTYSVIAGVRSTRAGTKSKPRLASLFVSPRVFNDDQSQPPVVEKVVISLPKEFELHLKAFPRCSKATLDTMQAQAVQDCTKKGADIGVSEARRQLGSEIVSFKVTAFNGTGGNKIELYLAGAPLDKAVEGTLTGKKGKAKTLTILIPADIQQAAPGSFASLTDLAVGIDKNRITKDGKTTNLFETTGCPSSKAWTIKAHYFVNQAAPASAGAPEEVFDQVDEPCLPARAQDR